MQQCNDSRLQPWRMQPETPCNVASFLLYPLAPEATVHSNYDGMTTFCEGEGSIVSVIEKVLEPQRVFVSVQIRSAMRHNRHIVIDIRGRVCEYQLPPCTCPICFHVDPQLLQFTCIAVQSAGQCIGLEL